MGQGPLSGVRIVELVGIGPGPFCAMMLADLGADVIRVDRAAAVRPENHGTPSPDVLARGRRSIGVDLKHADGVETVLRLVEQADGLIEGFRPGVTERLGLGPDACLARNPRLVYGRMTGFGQDGPMAQMAGHDINYIAISGMLHAIGRAGERPVPPLNLVGDFGGGGLLLALGIVSAILEARTSGQGQVVDAAMIEGAALLGTMMFGMLPSGAWTDERGVNLLDTGMPYYDTYETADGRYVSLGPLEPQFYAELLQLLGVADDPGFPQRDVDNEALRDRLTAIFASKTRDEWDAILGGSDACYAPVLSMREASEHPHMVARKAFTEVDGIVQPAPAPRFSRTPGAVSRPPEWPGSSTDAALGDWGFSTDQVAELRAAGAVR